MLNQASILTVQENPEQAAQTSQELANQAHIFEQAGQFHLEQVSQVPLEQAGQASPEHAGPTIPEKASAHPDQTAEICLPDQTSQALREQAVLAHAEQAAQAHLPDQTFQGPPEQTVLALLEQARQALQNQVGQPSHEKGAQALISALDLLDQASNAVIFLEQEWQAPPKQSTQAYLEQTCQTVLSGEVPPEQAPPASLEQEIQAHLELESLSLPQQAVDVPSKEAALAPLVQVGQIPGVVHHQVIEMQMLQSIRKEFDDKHTLTLAQLDYLRNLERLALERDIFGEQSLSATHPSHKIVHFEETFSTNPPMLTHTFQEEATTCPTTPSEFKEPKISSKKKVVKRKGDQASNTLKLASKQATQARAKQSSDVHPADPAHNKQHPAETAPAKQEAQTSQKQVKQRPDEQPAPNMQSHTEMRMLLTSWKGSKDRKINLSLTQHQYLLHLKRITIERNVYGTQSLSATHPPHKILHFDTNLSTSLTKPASKVQDTPICQKQVATSSVLPILKLRETPDTTLCQKLAIGSATSIPTPTPTVKLKEKSLFKSKNDQQVKKIPVSAPVKSKLFSNTNMLKDLKEAFRLTKMKASRPMNSLKRAKLSGPPYAPRLPRLTEEILGEKCAHSILKLATSALQKHKIAPEEKEVNTLDEGQLKALLDEAISYKNPKDREGKSDIFKELLQEAEAADEGKCKGLGESLSGKLPGAGGRHGGVGARKRRGRECGGGSGGSLQNLHALASEGVRGGGGGRRRPPVSARQREGGSLPDVELEALCPHYTSRATLDVAAPMTNSVVDQHDAQEAGCGVLNGLENAVAANKLEDVQRLRLTSTIGGGGGGGGGWVPSQQDASAYASTATPSSSDASSRAGSLAADPAKKPVDENGNALGCPRVDTNCMDRKKLRRVKVKNDRNIIEMKSEHVQGFRGDADIDSLVEYIDSPSNVPDGSKASRPTRVAARNGVKARAKEEDSRTTVKRRKEKLKRYNSLEEISKTKLEDLMEEGGPPQVTVDDAQLPWAGRRRYQEPPQPQPHPQPAMPTPTPMLPIDRVSSPETTIQDAEFSLVVKKRHGKKKRRSQCGVRASTGGLVSRGRASRQDAQRRRKSASSVPPSDKSDSSDLDSVHSLPDTQRLALADAPVSGDSTPQGISYADIARSRFDVPRPPVEPLLLPKREGAMVVRELLPREEYPPLGGVRCTDVFKDCSHTLSRTVNEKDCPDLNKSLKTGNSVSPARPAVILVDEVVMPPHPAPPPELTFGFEVNEQLLREAACDPTLYPPTVPTSLAVYLANAYAEALRKVDLGTAQFWEEEQ